jgi:hypothetical protein
MEAVAKVGLVARLSQTHEMLVDAVIGSLGGGAARGMRNLTVRAAVNRGPQAHRQFFAQKQKEGGWNVDKTLGDGRFRPDAWKREGNTIIVEDLKPNTASGRRAAEVAQKKYQKAAAEECPTCRYEFRATLYNP